MKHKTLLAIKILRSFGLASGVKLILGHLIKKATIRIFIKELKTWIVLRPWTGDFATLRQVLWDEEYNFQLKNVRTIIDLGANIGISTLVLANKFQRANVIALEPSKSNFELLSINTKGLNNVVLLNAAVWYEDGLVEILNVNAKSNEFQVSESNKNKQSSLIEAISISTLMKKFHVNKIDLLKIDIEGAEESIFKKSELDWLNRTNCIIIETHSDTFRNELLTMMNVHFDQTFKGEKLLFTNKHQTGL